MHINVFPLNTSTTCTSSPINISFSSFHRFFRDVSDGVIESRPRPSCRMWLQRPLVSPSFFTQTWEWRCQFCMPDCLDLTRCLSILFWMSACEQADSSGFAFVGAVEISSLRLRTVSPVAMTQTRGRDWGMVAHR